MCEKTSNEQQKEQAAQRHRLLNRLKAGAATMNCSGYLNSLDSLHRHDLMLRIVFDRLKRKIEVVEELYEEAQQNWNQTFFLLYFRTLGDKQNQQAYLKLARQVPYKYILRERTTPHAVEAMLLGASGLLMLYEEDDYVFKLLKIYEHLSAKYEIEGMQPEEWSFHSIRPANHPVLRLAEAAEFLSQDDLMMDRTMRCHTEEDIRKLFCIEAPGYWRTHFTPGNEGNDIPKRIGNFKALIIGINLVAILQFAYGSYMQKESLRENALNLLESLPAEMNRYIRAWYDAGGMKAQNAAESQALLQLATEYCAKQRCEECAIGRRILKSIIKD